MRRRIYEIVELSEDGDKLSSAYDFMIMTAIILSIVSLAFRTMNDVFRWIEYISVFVFIVDYILRLITADFMLNKSTMSFFVYPFTPMAVVDLFSVLPFFAFLSGGFRVPELFRLLRTLKLLRLLKFLRYSKSLDIIVSVFRRQKRILGAVATMAVCYVLVSALIMYNVEPDHFSSFFDAVYWAAITLTTVGYGDICPSTTIGRIVTVISSVFGIAVVALPSSVITAGYLAEINEGK